MKSCPHCAEEIQDDAIKCKHCGGDIMESPPVGLAADADTDGQRVPWSGKHGLSPAISMLALAVIGVLAIGAYVLLGSSKHTIHGTLEPSLCSGGAWDLDSSVEVREENGELIASGTTDGDAGDGLIGCAFTVQVPRAKFYDFTVGTHEGPSYSYEELSQNDWEVELDESQLSLD